jgi:predicted N-acetyltransferase YhbS
MKIISSEFQIRPAPPHSGRAVERLYDLVFGPDRFRKASHGLREGVEPVAALSWIAIEDGKVVGAVRYWPISVEEAPGKAPREALLLGPLAVAPNRVRRGIGTALVTKTLSLAASLGHDLVFLVGDADYYKRFGFAPATPRGFVMPGEAHPNRLQVKPLKPRILGQVAGILRAAAGSRAAVEHGAEHGAEPGAGHGAVARMRAPRFYVSHFRAG